MCPEIVRAIGAVAGTIIGVSAARRFHDCRKRDRETREIVGVIEKIVGGNYAARFLARDDSSLRDVKLGVNRLVEVLESDRARSIRSERARKSLLSDISHDIRTPLTSIIGYVGALRDDIAGDGAERDAYVTILDAKSRALKAMIDDIFQLAKLDADEIALHPESFDAAELVREILIDFLPEFREKSIELIVEIPDSSIFVRADRLSVDRIVRNLVRNALSHGADGRFVRVTVGFDPAHADADGAVVVSVADRGRGISAEDIPHVFDRLYRRDAARGTLTDGSGLGLAIVHSLALKNDAAAGVKSDPGGETVFSVAFRVPSDVRKN